MRLPSRQRAQSDVSAPRTASPGPAGDLAEVARGPTVQRRSVRRADATRTDVPRQPGQTKTNSKARHREAARKGRHREAAQRRLEAKLDTAKPPGRPPKLTRPAKPHHREAASKLNVGYVVRIGQHSAVRWTKDADRGQATRPCVSPFWPRSRPVDKLSRVSDLRFVAQAAAQQRLTLSGLRHMGSGHAVTNNHGHQRSNPLRR
jgi:hypothetical protein